MNNHNTAVKEAYKRGYRVTDDGNLLNPSGKRISGWKPRDKGYWYHSIKIKKKTQHFARHRLAAYQWFGEIVFITGIQVRHLNGNPSDCSKGNIVLGTQSENMMDRPKEERLLHARKAAAHSRKLTDKQIEQLRNDREDGLTYKELAEKYNVAKSTISYIVNNKTYNTPNILKQKSSSHYK